jgi:hypothetical protein
LIRLVLSTLKESHLFVVVPGGANGGRITFFVRRTIEQFPIYSHPLLRISIACMMQAASGEHHLYHPAELHCAESVVAIPVGKS